MESSRDWLQIVRTAARGLGLLEEDSRLAHMDSLILIDFVIELERLGQLDIPGDALRADTFASVESVAQMLSEIGTS